MTLVEDMKVLLGSSFALYLKAHQFHWNITGPNFAQYHEFLGDLYEEIFESIDTTAEEIRKLDAFAPGSLSRYMELSLVKDELNIPEALRMLSILAADNDIVLQVLYKAHASAEAERKFGTVSYLEDRITTHEKHAWMLKSF
jgi:starvation-inducible DNA-binding protein